MKNFTYLILLTFLMLMTQVILEGLTWFFLTYTDDILKQEIGFNDFLLVMYFYFIFKVFMTTLAPYVFTIILTASWVIKSKTTKIGYLKIGVLHFFLMVIPGLVFLYYIEVGKFGDNPIMVLLFYSLLLSIFAFNFKPFENKIFTDTATIKFKTILLTTIGFFCGALFILGGIFYLSDLNTKGGFFRHLGELMIILSMLFLILWIFSFLTIYIYNLIAKRT